MKTSSLSLKGHALRLLGMREHSRAELSRKLARHVQEGDDLQAVLNWLETKDFLSEARAAESIAHRKSARYGAARVQHDMRQQGVPEALIKANVDKLKDSEPERALAVWQRKFGTLPHSQQERAKQMRFMASRGFSSQTLDGIWRAQAQDNA